MICPNCGRKLKERQAIIEGRIESGEYVRRRIGWRKAFRRYDPFCTLRCGYEFGQAAWKKLLQRK